MNLISLSYWVVLSYKVLHIINAACFFLRENTLKKVKVRELIKQRNNFFSLMTCSYWRLQYILAFIMWKKKPPQKDMKSSDFHKA